MKDRNLNPVQVAAALDLSLDYIYRLIWTRRLRAHKRDGKWWVPASEVEKRKQKR